MNNFKVRLYGVALSFMFSLTGLPTLSFAMTTIASSGKAHVQLIELYTSEGCSSCPVADEWLSRLKTDPDLWTRFVPIAFHVDYWNRLGWKDHLSTKKMTERQQAIAQTWKEPSVYTPGMIRDGKEWREWHFKKSAPAFSEKVEPIELILSKNGDGEYSVKILSQKPLASMKLYVAELGMDISTQVTNGENAGKKLTHNFAVVNWDSQTLAMGETIKTFKLSSSQTETQKKPGAVVAWIEDVRQPIALQATGGFLK